MVSFLLLLSKYLASTLLPSISFCLLGFHCQFEHDAGHELVLECAIIIVYILSPLGLDQVCAHAGEVILGMQLGMSRMQVAACCPLVDHDLSFSTTARTARAAVIAWLMPMPIDSASKILRSAATRASMA